MASDSNEPFLYLLLESKCSPADAPGEDRHRLLSYWKLDLRTSNGTDNGELLSHWWPVSNTSATSFKDPVIPQLVNGKFSPVMADVVAMDLLPGSPTKHLVLGENTWPPQLSRSKLALLSTVDGSRSSSLTNVGLAFSFAVNPNKTKIFAADASPPNYRLLSASVAAPPSPPLANETLFEQLAVFQKGAFGSANISQIWFGPQSFDPNGSCLYLADREYNKIWAIEPLPNKAPVHVAGRVSTSTQAVNDGDFTTASFLAPREIVVTPDGYNLFVTSVEGFLIWITLESPCGRAQFVQTLAFDLERPFSGLVMHSANSTHLRLYLGTTAGTIFELEINQAFLYTGPPAPPSVPPSSAPLEENVSIWPPFDSLSPSSLSPSSSQESRLSFPPPSPTPTAIDSSAAPLPKRESGSRQYMAILIPLAAVVIAAVSAVGLLFFCHRHRRDEANKEKASSPLPGKEIPLGRFDDSALLLPANPIESFSLELLKLCTRGFHEEHMIGKGGAFGHVYWGKLSDTSPPVAIKVMEGRLTESKQKQFVAEVNTLSRLHHQNLVNLLGYCEDERRSALVYPFFPGGSLFQRLHARSSVRGQPTFPPLTLTQRASIALQIAEGLRYLHSSVVPPVIHRDIKSSNVLVRDGEEGKIHAVVSDFGLATFVERVYDASVEDVVRSTSAAGTKGYMDPMYVNNRKLTVKADVYAFGVVIYELLTGKRAIWEENGQEIPLTDWVKHFGWLPATHLHTKGVLDRCLGDDIGKGCDEENMVCEMLRLAADCTEEDDDRRPDIGTAAERLKTTIAEKKRRNGP
ncbi:hypothetical protein CBR_g22116 [Chara braunii]|uniref:Protein kinase domain-containing protein n=1 Tax=Chara braunii TaxID=69332 RepID=A0A388L245_CHABU|nr:hypothetical protein CBR_g22116 [Chara braunii]|eukprot:GBG76369.1 hypothetical protein CBR_g22116 [Chara braunii]